MTARREMEVPGGKWGASHEYHKGQEVKGVTPSTLEPFQAIMLGPGDGFKVTVSGKDWTVKPGSREVTYWSLLKNRGKKSQAHTTFRLIPT